MKGNFLLFDSTCPACTSVARRLRELNVRDLSVRSMSDPEIAEVFRSAGMPVPDKPALVQVADSEGLAVYTGFAMRMRLARMLGVRRAGEIVGLLAAEVEARVARRTGDERWTSRRRFLGGAAAAGAGALIFGAARPSAAAPSSPQPGTPLSAAAKQRLLASPRLQKASRIWGEIDESAIQTAVTEDGEQLVVVPHRSESRAVTTFKLGDEDALGITMTPNADGTGIRYYLASAGLPLAEQTLRDGQVVTSQLDLSAAPPGADPVPLSVAAFNTCFVACVGISVTAACLRDCVRCAGGGLGGITACARCAVCARARALECVGRCAPLL